MMEERLDRPGVQQLLRSMREGAPAPADARRRLAQRLEIAVSGGALVANAGGGPAASVDGAVPKLPAARARGGIFAKKISYGLLAGGSAAVLGGWLWLRPPMGSVRAKGAIVSIPAALPLAASTERPITTPAAPEPSMGTGAPLAAPPAVGSSGPPATIQRAHREPSEASRGGSLAAERRLLDAARAALVEGDPARAGARVAEHGRRFPQGMLAEEREALFVDVLVGERRYDEARRRASVFRARYPDSLLAPSVAAALDAIP